MPFVLQPNNNDWQQTTTTTNTQTIKKGIHEKAKKCFVVIMKIESKSGTAFWNRHSISLCNRIYNWLYIEFWLTLKSWWDEKKIKLSEFNIFKSIIVNQLTQFFVSIITTVKWFIYLNLTLNLNDMCVVYKFKRIISRCIYNLR